VSLPPTADKASVRRFWEAEPCGTRDLAEAEGSPAFFARLEEERYAREGFIESFARFGSWSGQRVLEVGVGAGSDFVRFARAGARAAGVDLTRRGVLLTRRRLALEGRDAAVLPADAERLPFRSDLFDFVYSWGVIHHTASPEVAAAEIVRVTRPGGQVCVMVYHRRSLVALQAWLRYGLLAGRPFAGLREVIGTHVESPGTQAYTIPEARRLLVGLDELRVTPVVTAYDLRLGRRLFLPAPLRRLVPRGLGWFLVLSGRKARGG
jgi:SAM-dependent methyltransferase